MEKPVEIFGDNENANKFVKHTTVNNRTGDQRAICN